MVRRGYRDPPYHNWTHAFTVAHFCFLLVRNLGLADKKLLRLEFLPIPTKISVQYFFSVPAPFPPADSVSRIKEFFFEGQGYQNTST